MEERRNWYALRTKVRMEKSAGELLRGKGYDIFVPVYVSRRKWADRYKDLELPLFAGYIFCRFDATKRLPILTTPGVTAVVGTRSGPVPVPPEELIAVQAFVAYNTKQMQPVPCFTAGEKVCVRSGAFAGLQGILLQVKNEYRLVISITLIQRAVAVEIDRNQVEPAYARIGAGLPWQMTTHENSLH
jgi:transcriptional antiterminator RfaH